MICMASSNITKEPRKAEGFVAYEIPSGNLYFFVSSKYEFKFGYIYKKVGHLKGQFINLKLKAQFIRQETPWGEFWTCELLPTDINIHPLHTNSPANLDK